MTDNFDSLIEKTFGSLISEQPNDSALGTDPLSQAEPALAKIKGKKEAGQTLTPTQQKLDSVGGDVAETEEENEGETLQKLQDMQKQQKAKETAQ